MKTIAYLVLIILLSGCSIKPVACLPKTHVPVSMTSDIPQIDIVDQNIDYSTFDAYSTKSVAWGLGKDKNELKQPLDGVKANNQYGKYDTVFMGGKDKKVYLTFDNGYENGNTPAILDILKNKEVSAVFFLTSQYLKENPDLVKRMISEGHIIGNHSYSHHSFPTIPLNEVYNEIMRLDAYMIQHFQYKMTLVRPPKGEFNEQSLALSKHLGYQTVMWSYAYYDYNVNDQPDEAISLKKNLDNAHPGAIYLLHSVSSTNVAILPSLIDGLRKQGYTISPYDLQQK